MPVIARDTWPELYEIDGTPQVDLLELQWQRSQRPKRPTKHSPVFSTERILDACHAGDFWQAWRMIEFNRAYPTRRHWHHRVHSEFGLPCDDECKPKRVYNGPSVIGQIKSKLPIEDFARKLTELRGNRVLTGKCPLHAEKNGQSFAVWPDEGKFKCFGVCGLYGDIIDLIQACEERSIQWRELLAR